MKKITSYSGAKKKLNGEMIDCKCLDYLLSCRLGQDFELSHFPLLNFYSLIGMTSLVWEHGSLMTSLVCFGETLHLHQFDRHSGCKIICRISIKSSLHGERQIDNWRV